MTTPANPPSRETLESQLAELQSRAFAIYEEAATRAESNPSVAETAYANAERESAPLIEQARQLNAERVRLLRKRARRWRSAAIAIAVTGCCALLWLLSMRR